MIYPLITEDGIVLNNMMPGEGALGGYTPKGTASSEGISLLLRGIVRAAIATNDPAKVAYARFLFNACCNYFFKSRPTANRDDLWNHSWILNGGEAFSVRGPLQASGDLATSGYIFGRDPKSSITFTAGRGLLNPAPDVVYQAVSSDSLFVWQNVFSDLAQGTELDVSFYIDAKGNKIFGTQKGGSFAQPSIRFADRTDQDKLDNPNGTVVLTTPQNGICGINYCITVTDINVSYSELYEAWPMWRKLAENEVSTAGDAIHWFADAFKLAKEMEPSNIEWQHALDRMLDVWVTTCNQESNNTTLFKSGASGLYNSFPLTYSYAYGKLDVTNPNSQNWDAQAPSDKYTAYRATDGYVTFDFPKEDGTAIDNKSIRYGFAFENSPLFLEYSANTSVSTDVKSTVEQTVQLKIVDQSANEYTAIAKITPTSGIQSIGIGQFLKFQQIPGDSLGIEFGDWSGEGGGGVIDDFVRPIYNSVPFPGRLVALVGDSISWMNTLWNPATGEPVPWDTSNDAIFGPGGGGGGASAVNGYYEYYGNNMAGYFNCANMLIGQRLCLEPAIQDSLRRPLELAEGTAVSRYRNGNNFAIAGSRTDKWELAQHDTLNNGLLEVGPMYNARRYINEFDVVVMMGGTNDLAGASVTAQAVFSNLRRFAYEFAVAGKWVFIQTIMPRTVEWLGGYYSPAGAGGIAHGLTANPEAAYTREKQELVRNRILEVNELLRAEFGNSNKKNNIWLVDSYFDLCGPNGRDPFGHLSHATDPLAPATKGNYRADLPNQIAMYDGLHPGAAGAYISGKKLAEVMLLAGIPDKSVTSGAGAWPYTYSSNLVGNPTFTKTTTRPNSALSYSTRLGRAIGLGSALYDGSHQQFIPDAQTQTLPANFVPINNTGLGYKYGQVPDYWQFYRSVNTGATEGWANFNEYTWNALSGRFPELTAYMEDSTWADGAVTLSIVNDSGTTALRVDVNLPMTGNKNEAFVLRTLLPNGQHGAWDSHGWQSEDFVWKSEYPTFTQEQRLDDVAVIPNTLYSAGDYIYGESRIKMSSVTSMYSWRMSLNFLAIDASAVSGVVGDTYVAEDVSTTGAPISAFANSQNFWPPSLIGNMGMVPNPDELYYRTPAIKAPNPTAEKNQRYIQFNFEFAFDCSSSGATAVILIKNPGVYKVVGG